ncbi:alpha/beta hydrolase family protein [Rasiella sp. SM2506]|uniref:alpha/beta hydrolase family protein n=1 Tax=Rasiella sp. SM2506 TaxID=3423914 RepID=UPI003D7A7E2B
MKTYVLLSLALLLSVSGICQSTLNRPQTPTPPFYYHIEEVTFENTKDSVTLAGTLTFPKDGNNFPVAVLISGSGAQNRNEELVGHKLFWVLADYLAKQGIAVLRYDDRGTAASTGNFKTALTQDFATDVEAAVDFLKTRTEFNQKAIGLIGHSEGGIIAPMVASDHPEDIGFIILLAGVTIPFDDLMKLQKELSLRAMGSSESYIEQEVLFDNELMPVITTTPLDELAENLKTFTTAYLEKNPKFAKNRGMHAETYTNLVVSSYTSPWLYNLLNYDPAEALKNTKCPILALNGENDTQVPSKENLQALEQLKSAYPEKNITTKSYPKLNHLFQESVTGSVFEYGKIEQTIAPYVLVEISSWIHTVVK